MIIGTQRKCLYCHQSGHRKTYKGKITCPLLINSENAPD